MKKSLFILLPILCLGACSKDSAPDEGKVTPHDYIDERDYSYVNKLDKPSNVVHNIDDLEAICDYYAFYKIENFRVTKAEDYRWDVGDPDNFKNELNYLYWHSEMFNGVMGMNAVKKGDNWDFSYTIYQNAHKNSRQYYNEALDLSYVTPTNNRTNYSFATDDPSLKVVDVATTQQLFYAIEHGYSVNPIEGSPAATYYQKSKDYLNSILSEDMDDFTKFYTIYDDISHITTYDMNSAYGLPDTKDPDLYPDEYCAEYKCFFLEGFFDDHMVVCDGFAKTLSMFCNMEGIRAVRALGTSDKTYDSRALPGHAFCFVNLENNWYLSDLTWGNQALNGNFEYQVHQYFLTAHNAMAPYTSTMWPEIQSQLVQVDYNNVTASNLVRYYANQTFKYGNDSYSKLITTENYASVTPNLVALLNSNARAYSYITVYFDNYTLIERFVNDYYNQISSNYSVNRCSYNNNEVIFYR